MELLVTNFLRNCQTVSKDAFLIRMYPVEAKCVRAPISPNGCQHVCLSLIVGILAGVNGILFLICISLMTSDVEHLFMFSVNLYIFFGEMYSDPLPIFKLDCLYY